MASGPYQSNLLRFLVGQYHQGINRHRQAVRKTRTQVDMGAQIGTAVALSFVQKVVQVSRTTGRQLVSSLSRLRLAEAGNQSTVRLIDFSGFDERVLLETAVHELPSQTTVLRNQAGADNDLDAELARSPDAAWLIGESVMAQSLVSIDSCLQPAQVRKIANHRSFTWQETLGWCWPLARLWGTSSDIYSSVADRPSQVAAHSQGQITGLASDINTRSLQLVIDYKQVWVGLSSQQQTEIQRKIWDLMGPLTSVSTHSHTIDSLGDLNNSVVLTGDTSSPLVLQQPIQPVLTSAHKLVISVHSFWVALLQVLDEWLGNHKVPLNIAPALQISSSYSSPALRLVRPLSDLSLSSPRLSACLSLKANELRSLTLAGNGDRSASGCWEADVVSVTYLEHPLEKLLKWIDRIFLWLERLWHALRRKYT